MTTTIMKVIPMTIIKKVGMKRKKTMTTTMTIIITWKKLKEEGYKDDVPNY